MGKRSRFIFVPVAVVALMVLALPGAADHGTRTDVRNIQAVADIANTDTLANSDLAFWGDMAIQGMWEGFLIHNISNPNSPSTIVDYNKCGDPAAGLGGGQGDVIVWQNLVVRAWNSDATATAFCGTDASGNLMPVPTGFEGIHIFDISNPASPQLVTGLEIDTDAPGKPVGIVNGNGSHTLTAVPDPANNKLYVYVGGSSQMSPGMDLVEIPLNNPAAADWYGRAVNPSGRACHDITVYMIHKNRAVCSGSWPANSGATGHHGYSYWSMDAADGGSLANPVLLYERDIARVNNQTVTDPNPPPTSNPVENGATLGHTTSFSWDGKILLWSSEPGGGVQSNCEETDSDETREMYFLSSELGELKGLWRTPTQSVHESCASVHIMQSIPTTNGRDVMSSGTYMAGTYLVDYTDPVTPTTLGWSDPPPDAVPPADRAVILGGAWATYWYNGFLYESNIKKGLFVMKSTSPEAQTPIKLPFLNPQTFMPLPQAGTCKGKTATVVGTGAADNLVGTTGKDVVAALGGNDKVNGKGGRDLVCGGGGKDRLRGKGGNDKLFGQAQNDKLNGGGGRDRCVGGGGNDTARKCEKTKSL
jgi:RTX calcium-binding nonapeptide repeat (4 copies)/LVIVD repeat